MSQTTVIVTPHTAAWISTGVVYTYISESHGDVCAVCCPDCVCNWVSCNEECNGYFRSSEKSCQEIAVEFAGVAYTLDV